MHTSHMYHPYQRTSLTLTNGDFISSEKLKDISKSVTNENASSINTVKTKNTRLEQFPHFSMANQRNPSYLKSWSCIKAEKAKLNKLLEKKNGETSACQQSGSTSNHGSDEEFSDDLPDLDDPDNEVCAIQEKTYRRKVQDEDCYIERCVDVPHKKLKLSDGSASISFSKDVSQHSKVSTNGNMPLLFTNEHKNKLAKLLSKVRLKEKIHKEIISRSISPTLSNNSQGSERHFMDILDSLNNSGKLPDESDCLSDTSVESVRIFPAGNSPIVEEQCRKDSLFLNFQDNNSNTCSSLESVQPYPSTTDITDKKTSEWVESHISYSAIQPFPVESDQNVSIDTNQTFLRKVQVSKITNYLSDKSPQNTCRKTQHVGSVRKVLFPPVEENDVIESFSAMHINTLDAALEEGDMFFNYSLNMLKSFVIQKKPTLKIMEEMLLDKGLLGNLSPDICVKCFYILRYVWQTYPDLISIKWDLLSDMIDGVTYKQSTSSYTNFQAGMLLHLYVLGLEINLYKVSLKNRDKLLKTFVFKYLSSDAAFRNMKEIVKWIEFCIKSATSQELKNQPSPTNLKESRSEQDCISFGAPCKLLPNLNRLLSLGIEISRSCIEAAQRVAWELRKVYFSLTDVEHRKLLLQHLCSDLLLLKLTQTLLEENCCGNVLYAVDLPPSFKRVKHVYFNSKPSSDGSIPVAQSSSKTEQMYSADNVEELSFLVFYIIKSYLACKKRELHEPLHMRHKIQVLTQDDKTELGSLAQEARQFYQHLQTFVPELSRTTEQYIIMLCCLSEASY